MAGLLFDPFSGISGDMILGALLDLGLPLDSLRQTVAGLGIEAQAVQTRRVMRGGIACRQVEIPPEGAAPERHLADVMEMLARARLDPHAEAIARGTFERLARAEARIHGTEPERVHFHEVGAVDAIADIAGVAAGIVELSIESAYTRPVAVGRGWIHGAHGALPVPAPAALELLRGCPLAESPYDGELVTPTGAALLAQITGGRRAPAEFRPRASGFGAGSRDPADHPNCLRLILLEDEPPAGAVLLFQADVDDMSPELVPGALRALLDAGALDAWAHPVSFKKGRTGLRLEALVPADRRPAAAAALFAHSTTIGLRFWPVDREILPRTVEEREWRGFRIRVKRAILPDGTSRVKAEYDDVEKAARALGVPPLQLLQDLYRELAGGPDPKRTTGGLHE
jgi:uncharacterized protein (TIGR00299 family) protein